MMQSGLVLAVGLDDLTLACVRTAVRGTELTVCAAREDAAVDRAAEHDGPVIVLLEWNAEQEGRQARLCSAVRSAVRPGQSYVLALGSVTDIGLPRAMKWPADDVLSRPFGNEHHLLMRLRKALANVKAARPVITAREALEEAVSGERTGDVVVRAGEVVGHIHMQRGAIVWANVSSAPPTIEEILGYAGFALSPEVVASVRTEAYETRAHFMDVLVEHDMIDPDLAKTALRAFIASRVEMVLDLPAAVALFLPKAGPETDHVRIRADEIPSLRAPAHSDIAPIYRPSLPPPTWIATDELTDVVDQVMQLDGATSAVILDRRTGASVFAAGREIDPSIAWSQLTALGSLGPGAEDALGTIGESCFVTRALANAPGLALFVVLRRADTTLGMARSLVAQIAAGEAVRKVAAS